MAKLAPISTEARVSEGGVLSLEIQVSLRPGTYDAVLVVGEPRVAKPAVTPPALSAEVVPLAEFIERARREHILRVLDAHGGNRTQAARALDVDVRTVFRLLEKEPLE